MLNNSLFRSLAVALSVLGMLHAEAQNITGYRYWFNDDVAAVNVVDLAPMPAIDQEPTLTSVTLPLGHHLVTLQFRDADGRWSAPWTTHFVQRGTTVDHLEYWFNDDVANSTSVSVTPGEAPVMSEPLASNSLPIGFHTVTVRTVDARGERSVPYTTGFTRNGGAIAGYEYWLDDAYEDRTGADIGPTGTLDLIAALPVPTTEGDHLITIRFRDAEGGWSVPLSSTFSFFVGLEEIAGVSNYLIFPNPVNEQLSLRVDATIPTDLRIQVTDAGGRTVQHLDRWIASGIAHHSWDISALAQGTYLLRISSAGQSIHMPFVKH
ncbi:MAG: T9SS type A sorting domain-containing protein [Flavobacteriales bacterium]|jgi:hypothetical protein|nr:T9SS type A sorting domain-containing protein [Flavobacteriales bacterium]